MKHELLVPAGNMESLYQAIFNGCDAVYVGGKNFGARKFATNFSNEELISAIKFCHLYGVKIYVTMNTLIHNDEVSSFLEQVSFLYKNGVDAIIMQDFGMISLVRKIYPKLSIHASTQANNCSKEVVLLLYQLGVTRVVLPRELSLEEISLLDDIPIEKEAFIHGALCICYSGCCLMSSMIGGRSGNRGECAGSCRLPYSLYYKNKKLKEGYLLSTKELNTSLNISKLLDSNILSFKIEGRMKSPEYVGFITRFYRRLIDKDPTFNLEEETDKLKTIFNRGFTEGHLFSTEISSLLNTNRPNHIGLSIGKVLKVDSKYIYLSLNRPLHQFDGIRFLNSDKGMIVNYLYNQDKKLITSSNSICLIDNKIGLTEKDIVTKTQDFLLMEDLKKCPIRKVPVSFKVIAREKENLIVEISDGEVSFFIKGEKVDIAKNQPISKEEVKKQFERLGNTPFYLKEITIEMSNSIFIPKSNLNSIRRELVERLKKSREEKLILKELSPCSISFDKLPVVNNPVFSAKVKTEEQYLACKNNQIKRIYTDNLHLYQKYVTHEDFYYVLPRCLFTHKESTCSKNLVSEYFSYDKNKHFIADYFCNVTNIYTAYYLYQLGVSTVTLSPEVNEEELIEFPKLFLEKFQILPDLEILGYGRVCNMIIKGNVLDIKEFDLSYYLVDKRKRYFKVYYDGRCTMIYNSQKEMRSANKINSYSYRFEFLDESGGEVDQIIKKFKK